MRKKIRFYKALLVEVIETLCSICLYLERVGRYQHIEESRHMRGHFNILKEFSEDLRKGMRAYINRADKIADGQFAAESEINHAHWIVNHNGTISCSYCHTWFNKDDRYSYMCYCPYCKIKMIESEDKNDSV